MEVFNEIKAQLDRVRGQVDEKVKKYFSSKYFQNSWRFWFCLAYLMCPIDLIPDFIPIVGYLDDIAVIAKLLGVVINITKRKINE